MESPHFLCVYTSSEIVSPIQPWRLTTQRIPPKMATSVLSGFLRS
jgi:hypothetical protein